jgi:hypothetical protein
MAVEHHRGALAVIVSFFLPQTTTKKGRVPSARPLPYDFEWRGFVSYLRECSAEPAPRSHKQTGTVEVNAMGMAIYPDGARRGNDAAFAADWIGLDIDDKDGSADTWKFDGLVQYLTEAGVAFVVYTTTSCTEERHCLRLILPFDRQVWAEEWPVVWSSFAAWIGQIDRKTKDVARILYEPRLWAGAYNRFYASPLDLPFVRVDDIVERYSPATEAEQHVALPPSACRVGAELRFASNLDDFDTSPIIKPEWVEEAYQASPGGRMYQFLCRVAMSARARSIHISDCDLVAIGRRLAGLIGRRDVSDIPRDAARALSWSLRQNLTNPTSSSPRLPPPWPWS